jgi:hydrogenase-4 component E
MTEILTIACTVAFIATIFMHVIRKNTTLVALYALQSFGLVIFLTLISWVEGDRILTVVALMTFIIKVVLAPYFFYGVIKRSRIYFSSGAYIGIPFSLVSVLILMFFSTKLLVPFLAIVGQSALLPYILYPLLVSGILTSLYFIVNHRDVLGQILGILSLENWTMQTGIAIGVKHALILEIGMSFDIAVWIIIALMFITRLHQSFGTLHLSHLTHLKED